MSRAPSSIHRPLPAPVAAPASRGLVRRPVGAPTHAAGHDGARRRFGRNLRAALGAAAVGLLLSSACGDDSSAGPALDADAGPSCQRGTRNCACVGGSGCRGDLLCIAGLCSSRMEEAPEAVTLPPRPRPALPDPGDPDPDAGPSPSTDAGALDASVPGDGDAGDAG